jgi:hypothetical protein
VSPLHLYLEAELIGLLFPKTMRGISYAAQELVARTVQVDQSEPSAVTANNLN